MMVAFSCSSPICSRIVRRYKIYFPASAAAINSASVELCATVSWYFVLYSTVPPAIVGYTKASLTSEFEGNVHFDLI